MTRNRDSRPIHFGHFAQKTSIGTVSTWPFLCVVLLLLLLLRALQWLPANHLFMHFVIALFIHVIALANHLCVCVTVSSSSLHSLYINSLFASFSSSSFSSCSLLFIAILLSLTKIKHFVCCLFRFIRNTFNEYKHSTYTQRKKRDRCTHHTHMVRCLQHNHIVPVRFS